MKIVRTIGAWIMTCAALVVCAPLAALATASADAPLNLPASISVSATTSDCFNNPGPFITLSGALTFRNGLNGRLIFQNNVKGTHTNDDNNVTVDVVIVPKGGTPITFAKQPPEGGVGGNPYIYLRINKSPLIPLGRCVQGLKPASFDLLLASVGEATVTANNCYNNSPEITLEGEVILGGITGQLVFSNNAKMTHNTLDDPENVVVDFVILNPGQTIQIPKSPDQGGVGGNPFIYFQFTDASGSPLTKKIFLGRCVQMGN